MESTQEKKVSFILAHLLRVRGTGYLSILGVIHSAGASFSANPMYFDPKNILKLAIEGGRRHQFYISNYPRYYYHNRYQGTAFLNLRGFNENDGKPFIGNKKIGITWMTPKKMTDKKRNLR